MNDSEEIRGLLADAPAPPPGIDLDTVLIQGHRRVVRRRFAGLAGGASLALVLVAATGAAVGLRSHHGPTSMARPSTPATTRSTPPSTPTCPATALALPPGFTSMEANAVDPTGRLIAGRAISGENFTPFLWTDGVPARLPIHAESAEIDAINANGVAVGIIQNNNYRSTVIFRYQNGVVTKLHSPVPDTWNLYPQPFINEAGVVVVNAEPPGASGGDRSIVIEWPASSTTGHTLGIAETDDVTGIGDAHLIGTGYSDGNARDPVVWDLDGHHRHTLPVPPGLRGAAYAISGDWVVGGFWDHDSSTTARWNLRSGGFDQPGDVSGPLENVNSQGWTASGGAVDKAGSLANLGSPPGTDGNRATGIADNGRVVGVAYGPDNRSVPLAWTC